MLSDDNEDCVYILGLWADGNHTVFRHVELGFRVPIYLRPRIGVMPESDLLTFDLEKLPKDLKGGWFEGALFELQNNFEFEGRLSGEDTTRNILGVVEMLPRNSLVFLIGCTEKMMDGEGAMHDLPDHIDLNRSLRSCAAASDKIVFVGIDDHVKQKSDRIGSYNHYSREVYFRLFSEIKKKTDEWTMRDSSL